MSLNFKISYVEPPCLPGHTFDFSTKARFGSFIFELDHCLIQIFVPTIISSYVLSKSVSAVALFKKLKHSESKNIYKDSLFIKIILSFLFKSVIQHYQIISQLLPNPSRIVRKSEEDFYKNGYN